MAPSKFCPIPPGSAAGVVDVLPRPPAGRRLRRSPAQGRANRSRSTPTGWYVNVRVGGDAQCPLRGQAPRL